MIFTKRQAGAIARGQHTRMCIPVVTGRPCPVKLNHDYPVQYRDGRRLPMMGRIKIVSHAQQVAGEITYAEARAEGCRTTVHWKTEWVRRRDAVWLAREKVDLVAVYDDEVSIVDWILLERFEQRHARTMVWALTIEPVVDAPRFMAHPTRTSGDYITTTTRAIDPVECIDEATQERYAKATQEQGERQRASFRRDLEAERQRRRNLRVA